MIGLQMRKLGYREVKYLPQGSTASESWSRYLNLGCRLWPDLLALLPPVQRREEPFSPEVWERKSTKVPLRKHLS